MTITELLNTYNETDFETVLTKYLKDPEALMNRIDHDSPNFAALMQDLRSHIYDETYNPEIEEAFHDGMVTMLQLLVYLEKQAGAEKHVV